MSSKTAADVVPPIPSSGVPISEGQEGRSTQTQPPTLDEPLQNEDAGESMLKAAKKRKLQRHLLIVCFILIIVVDFGGALGQTSSLQVFEEAACERYYAERGRYPSDGGSLKGLDCSIDAVQNEYAIVRGISDTLDNLPIILFAIPFGILGDRIGRKKVLLLSLLGLTLQDVSVKIICLGSFPLVFPLRLVWLTSALRCIGGGENVAQSMIFTAIADIFEEKDRANIFFQLAAAFLGSEIAAQPLAALMMKKNPWIPFLLSSAISIVGVLITLATFPETLEKVKSEILKRRNSTTIPDQEAQAEAHEQPAWSDLFTRPKTKNWGFFKLRTRRTFQVTKEMTSFAFTNLNVFLLLFVFFIQKLNGQTTQILPVYVHRRFGWSFAKGTTFPFLKGTTALLVLVFLLPLFTRFLTKRLKQTPIKKDLTITRFCALFQLLGCIFLALSPSSEFLLLSAIILALGMPFHLSARAVVTSLVEKDRVATLYTMIAVVSAFGTFAIGPTLWASFNKGMSLSGKEGGFAQTLVFWIASIFAGMGVVSVWLVRLGWWQLVPENEEGERRGSREVGEFDNVVNGPVATQLDGEVFRD